MNLKAQLRKGIIRLRSSWPSILQSGFAAGLAYWVARHWIGHSQPFFAPMAAILVLGLSGGARVRRSIELVVGVTLGVTFGDLFIGQVGSGVWQIAIAVSIALMLATLVDRSPLVANQAAIGSVLIATIMPPGTSGGFERASDALVGGMVGLLVIAVMPAPPLNTGRREVAKVLTITSNVLGGVAAALRGRDSDACYQALIQARGTQGNINSLIAAAKYSKESTRLSPLLWRDRHRVKSLERILNPVDNAIRNTRVLARRALTLTEDHDRVSEEQVELIEELSAVARKLSDLYLGNAEPGQSADLPGLVRHLRELGSRVGLQVASGNVLSAQVILAQTRSIIVDLLQVCGMSRESALAVLLPTSDSPAVPPEIWRHGEEPNISPLRKKRAPDD